MYTQPKFHSSLSFSTTVRSQVTSPGHRLTASVRVLIIYQANQRLSALSSAVFAALEIIIYGDITDYASILSSCSGCSVVFHLAALVEPLLPDPSNFFSVNIGGLKNVLEAVKETKKVIDLWDYFICLWIGFWFQKIWC